MAFAFINKERRNSYPLDPLLVMRGDVSDSRQDQRNHFQAKGDEEEAEPGKILHTILPLSNGDSVTLFCESDSGKKQTAPSFWFLPVRAPSAPESGMGKYHTAPATGRSRRAWPSPRRLASVSLLPDTAAPGAETQGRTSPYRCVNHLKGAVGLCGFLVYFSYCYNFVRS